MLAVKQLFKGLKIYDIYYIKKDILYNMYLIVSIQYSFKQ